MSDAATAGPYVQFGEEDGKSPGSQLLVDQLLAMAAGVEGIPLGTRLVRWCHVEFAAPSGVVELRLRVRLQGSAPFGKVLESCSGPIHASHGYPGEQADRILLGTRAPPVSAHAT